MKCQTTFQKCEILFQSLRQIYILEIIFTYHTSRTLLPRTKHFKEQIDKMQNTFTSPEAYLQSSQKGNVPNTGSDTEVIKWVVWMVNTVSLCRFQSRDHPHEKQNRVKWFIHYPQNRQNITINSTESNMNGLLTLSLPHHFWCLIHSLSMKIVKVFHTLKWHFPATVPNRHIRNRRSYFCFFNNQLLKGTH